MFLSEEDELYQWKVGEAVASDTFDSAMTWVHLYPPLQLVFWHHVIWFKGMILKHSSISMISWVNVLGTDYKLKTHVTSEH